MLFYNCLSESGEKLKPLAENFALFDNLPISLLIDKSHIELYPAKAWGTNPGYVQYHHPEGDRQ